MQNFTDSPQTLQRKTKAGLVFLGSIAIYNRFRLDKTMLTYHCRKRRVEVLNHFLNSDVLPYNKVMEGLGSLFVPSDEGSSLSGKTDTCNITGGQLRI